MVPSEADGSPLWNGPLFVLNGQVGEKRLRELADDEMVVEPRFRLITWVAVVDRHAHWVS